MTTAAKYTLLTLCALSSSMVSPLGSSAQQSPAGGNVVTAAGEQYRAGPLHRLVLGRHYRELWTTPIEVEVLDLSTFAGGITPLQRGGADCRPGRCDSAVQTAGSTPSAPWTRTPHPCSRLFFVGAS